MELQYILYLLLGLLLVLIYAVLYLAAKISRQNRIINRPTENYTDSLEIVEDAQRQANTIVEKAVESAKHILFETEYLKQDITKEMQDSLNKVAEETIKMVQGRSSESEHEFRAIVDEIKADFVKEASNKLTNIEKVTLDETNDFKEILRRETIGSQMFIGNKINQDFQQVQKEINDYKTVKLQDADQQVQDIIKQVVIDVLGPSVTLPVQEELIMASLEKAKKTGVFKGLENKPVTQAK